MLSDADYLAVACVRKPHGLKGFIKLSSFSGDFSHLKKAKTVKIVAHSKEYFFDIEATATHAKDFLIKLKSIETPEAAKVLNGGEIFLKRSELIPCKSDEFYFADLVGCTLLFDSSPCAKVVAIIDNGLTEMLECELTQSDVEENSGANCTQEKTAKSDENNLSAESKNIALAEKNDSSLKISKSNSSIKKAQRIQKTVLIPFSKNVIGKVDLSNKTIELLEDWFLK